MRCALCVIASVGALEAHAQRRLHSVRHASRDGRVGERGRATCDRSLERAPAGRVPTGAMAVRGAGWGTGDPLGMCALPITHVGAVPERLTPVTRPL